MQRLLQQGVWRSAYPIRTDLYVANADGTGLRLLAEDVSQNDHPWSAVGRLIAFARSRTDNALVFRELWTVDVETGALTLVTGKRVTGGISWQATYR